MKHRRLLLFSVLIVVLLVAVPVLASSPQAAPHARQTQHKVAPDLAVLEAYVNYMLAQNSRPNCVYFLRFSPQIKKPVRNLLLLNLARHVPPVVAADRRIRYGRGFTDRKTHRAAMIYDIVSIKWLGRNEAEIKGGWQTGGMSSIRALYKIVREGQHWRVTSESTYGTS